MTNTISKVARIILGLLYVIFGSNKFLNFLHMPKPEMSDAAQGFFQGLMGTGYFFPLLGATETICGLLLIMGIAAPVGLVVLAPVTLHIFLFHACLTPGLKNLGLPLVMSILHITAMRGYWGLYRPLFLKG